MAKWFIADPYTEQVAQVDINKFEDIAEAIGCEWVERVKLSAWPGDRTTFVSGLWVNEEGFITRGLPVIITKLYPSPVCGRVLFGCWGETHNGDMEFYDSACPHHVAEGMFKFTKYMSDDYEMQMSESVENGISILNIEPVLKS